MDVEKKTIAKNSLLLYFRTFLIMIVSLYTVRVTLDILGFEDYGIFNAIGGIVTVFAFLSNTLTSVSQRYFSFYIGKNDPSILRKYFNAVLLIYIIIAVIVVATAEIFGILFLNNYLTIPEDRLTAANYVYQFSVFSLFVSFVQIPYNSIIIARERMDIYAYISIFEVALKLATVFTLLHIDIDSLILYSILLFIVTLLKFLFYSSYASVKFKETKFEIVYSKNIYKELGSYMGWNTFGVFAAVVKTQGVVVILNVFFGPVINAAYAIACQVNTAVNQFVSSFTLAFQPQIVKKYAEDQRDKMFDLIYLSSKYSFFLLLVVALPCIFEMSIILKLWLKKIPDYTVDFSVLLVISALIESLCTPLVTSIQATGIIKHYNISLGALLLLSIPVSTVTIKLGMDAISTVVISLVFTVIAQILRVYYMLQLTGMPLGCYVKNVIFKIIFVIIPSLIINIFLMSFMDGTLSHFIITTICSIICTCLCVVLFGLTYSERKSILNLIRKFIK